MSSVINNEAEDLSADEDRTPQVNLTKVMEDLGFGRFQYLAYAAIGFGINSVGFWFYILGYLI